MVVASRVIAGCVACASLLTFCSPALAEVTRTGTLQATVVDRFRADHSTTHYRLDTGGRTIPVVPTDLEAEPGDRVVVTGEMRDGKIVGEVEAVGPSADPETLGPSALLETTEPRKVAVLLLTFGASGSPWSPGETRSTIFTAPNSVNVFLKEQSHGKISLTGKLREDGDVFGPFGINTPTAGCPYETWRTEANAAAAAEGIDLTGYEHIIYAFPYTSSCSWLGRAALNGITSWINGRFGGIFGPLVDVHTIAHELGHNLGLQHAGSWTCTSGGVRVQISNTCTTREYGDPFDVMGNILPPRHSNGWNLAKLGILAPENVETVATSGIYALRSALHPTDEPTVLRVPRAYGPNDKVSSWYYLEIRERGGIFENFLDATTTGVSIRATAEFLSPETLLLDANPATTSFADAPLQAGQTFDGRLVQITTLSAGEGHALVDVWVDDEPPATPSDLQASVDADGVRLSWVGTDNLGVKRYFVFRDGVQLGTTTTPSFIDFRQAAGDREYVVVAEDESLNKSDPSEPLTVTVPIVSGPDCTAAKCKLAYRYSGAAADWTVPPGVHGAHVVVEGGRGGNVDPGAVGGAPGARIRARLEPLETGQVVDISVGGRGRFHFEGGAGGFNGGGDGGLGGGGGGYTKVSLESTLEVLAAGGGGRGMGREGLVNTPGGSGSAQGSSANNGFAFTTQGTTLGGGKGGMGGGAGGVGGAGGQVSGAESSCPGGAQAGETGASGGSLLGGGGVAGAGGGGGGGWVGGGQGGGAAGDACGMWASSGGGGGGSSFVAEGRLIGYEGASGEDGWLSVEYDNPVVVSAHTHTTVGTQEIDVPAAAGVLSNASAPDGVELTLSLVAPPNHGSLDLREDGSFTYVPENGYLGTDHFDYRASDPRGNYAVGRVTLNMVGPPSAAILSPPDGGTFTVGQSVPTTFSCSEGPGGPGLSSCDDSTGTSTVSEGSGHLDTSTLGPQTYVVTADSNSGLTGNASISYTVVPAPQPPDEPGEPPNDPGEPPGEPPQEPPQELPLRVNLSLAGVERNALRKLRRTGRLVVAARIDKAGRLALTGRARLRIRVRRGVRTRFVAVFKRKVVRFPGAGNRRVALVLTPRGRRALRRMHQVRLVIAARAIDAAGQRATRRVELTLRR